MTPDVTAASQLWPGPFGLEAGRPWTMRGRQVTAWFSIGDDVIERHVHPDLRPSPATAHRSRARFYLLEADGERFHEVVISMPIRAAGIDGEASALLWSDSERYAAWARDGFGWAALPATFGFSGTLWAARTPLDGTGVATMRSAGRHVALEVIEPVSAGEGSEAWMTRLPWLAPRRVLHRAGLDGETREVLEIIPEMRRAGDRLAGRGRLTIDFGPDDPLTTPEAIACDLEIVDGFEITVGADVRIVLSERLR
jgi:hypothetical protein